MIKQPGPKKTTKHRTLVPLKPYDMYLDSNLTSSSFVEGVQSDTTETIKVTLVKKSQLVKEPPPVVSSTIFNFGDQPAQSVLRSFPAEPLPTPVKSTKSRPKVVDSDREERRRLGLITCYSVSSLNLHEKPDSTAKKRVSDTVKSEPKLKQPSRMPTMPSYTRFRNELYSLKNMSPELRTHRSFDYFS